MSGILSLPGNSQPMRTNSFVLRSGRSVYMEPLRAEYDTARRLAGAKQYQGPQRVLVRATASYNCAAQAFGSRRGVLIDGLPTDPEPLHQGAISSRSDFHDMVMAILQEDDYSLRRTGDPHAGDIVLYGRTLDDILHVGVATGCYHPLAQVPLILSQFGVAGEFLHGINDVPSPQIGTLQAVWTQGDGL